MKPLGISSTTTCSIQQDCKYPRGTVPGEELTCISRITCGIYINISIHDCEFSDFGRSGALLMPCDRRLACSDGFPPI